MVRLSIIIVSYNNQSLIADCIKSLKETLFHLSPQLNHEIIIVDNSSSDKTRKIIDQLPVKLISNKTNLGYPKANNQALKQARGQYILFLNPDVICYQVNFPVLLDLFDQDPQLGALTVGVRLQNGKLDPACHRGFPTLLNSLCYFLKLEKLGGSCGGYHLVGKDLTAIHEIDSGSGAFFLTRKTLMDRLGGFDEDFFMYGEDLDLSYRIKQMGLKILFYPHYQVTHLKHQSGFRPKLFFEAMSIFYRKHYKQRYPEIVNRLVYGIIDLKKKIA